MNHLKSLAVLAVLTAAPLFSFAQNANALVIFPSGDHYQYDHNHDRRWNEIHEREWLRHHEREIREHREREYREHRWNH